MKKEFDHFELSSSKIFLNKTKEEFIKRFPRLETLVSQKFSKLEKLHKNNYEEIQFAYHNVIKYNPDITPENLDNILSKFREFDNSDYVKKSHEDLINITEKTLTDLVTELEKRTNLKDYEL